MRVRVARAVATLALAVACVPLAAAAAEPERVTRLDSFTTRAPGAPTGLGVAIDYRNPNYPHDKPPAIDTVIDHFAEGFRFDTSAPAQCMAADLVLILLGPAACPAASIVGTGTIDVATGLVGPLAALRTDATFLNRDGQMIILLREHITHVGAIVRASITDEGRTLTIPVRLLPSTPLPLPGVPIDLGALLRGQLDPKAILPGTPLDGGAVKRERLTFPPVVRDVGGQRRSYMTTPPNCPADGRWTNRSHFVFGDGTTTITTDHVPCDPP